MYILYKPGPDLYMDDWLSSQSHTEKKDKEIEGMKLSINAISLMTDKSSWISIDNIQEVT